MGESNSKKQTGSVIGPKVGDVMPDGTVYAGTSPDTGKALYATPFDAPLTYTFNQARKYAAKLDAHGHDDWRVPTIDELNLLFDNRAAIGGFDLTGESPTGWYWSSSEGIKQGTKGAWDLRFSDDGVQGFHINGVRSSVRCVR